MAKLTLQKGTDWDSVAKDQLIPEGRWPARIDKVDERESQSGNPMWGVTFTFTEEPLTGRKLFETYSLQPRALWKLRALAKAAGVNLKGRSELDSEELQNVEVGVVVTHDEYEGQPRTRANTYFPLE